MSVNTFYISKVRYARYPNLVNLAKRFPQLSLLVWKPWTFVATCMVSRNPPKLAGGDFVSVAKEDDIRSKSIDTLARDIAGSKYYRQEMGVEANEYASYGVTHLGGYVIFEKAKPTTKELANLETRLDRYAPRKDAA